MILDVATLGEYKVSNLNLSKFGRTSWSYSYDKVEGELGGRGELGEEG